MRLDVVASGMVTPVGFNAPSSCAAMRVGIDGFQETRFMFDGDYVRAGVVSAPDDMQGLEKLGWMAASAIDQCLFAAHPAQPQDTAVVLCLAEATRPGRLHGLDPRFFANVCAKVQERERLGQHRRLFVTGTMGGVEGLLWAEQVLEQGLADHCVVVGVDSYVHGPILTACHEARRLLTVKNSDGFIPGEAGAAVLVSRTSAAPVAIECLGIGWGRELATQDSGKPLRGDGLAQAYREAFKAAGRGYPNVDYRISDIAGDQYAFKEAALGLLRTMRVRKEAFYIWHPADCVGRVGAASVPLVLGVALAAARRSYSPGPGALCHFTDDTGIRAAAILHERDRRALVPQ